MSGKNGISLQNAPKYLSARMGATEVANLLVEGQIRTIRGRLEQVVKIDIDITDTIRPMGRSTRLLVAEQVQSQLDGFTPCRVKGRPYGGEVVELGDWKMPSVTPQKFEDRWRPATWLGKTEKSDENVIADAARVRIARSIHRRLMESQGLIWHPVGDDDNENQTD